MSHLYHFTEQFNSYLPISHVHVCELICFSHVQLFVTLWAVAHQVSLSTGFSRKEHWTGLQCPPPGDLPEPGLEHVSLTSPALAGGFFITSATWEAQFYVYIYMYPLFFKFFLPFRLL